MWATIERLWSDTLTRAQRLPESARDAKTDDEWSLVETLRHLIFATDVWVGRMVLGQPSHTTRSDCHRPTTQPRTPQGSVSTSLRDHHSRT